MFLTGESYRCSSCHRLRSSEWFGHSTNCRNKRGIDIEWIGPLEGGIQRIKIIRFDDKTHNMIVDFAKDGESIMEIINRLWDIAEVEAPQYQQQQQ
jgi:hypothetical protein